MIYISKGIHNKNFSIFDQKLLITFTSCTGVFAVSTIADKYWFVSKQMRVLVPMRNHHFPYQTTIWVVYHCVRRAQQLKQHKYNYC